MQLPRHVPALHMADSHASHDRCLVGAPRGLILGSHWESRQKPGINN